MTLSMYFALAVILIPLILVMFDRWRIDLAALVIITVLGLAQYFGLGVLGEPQSPGNALETLSGFGQPVVIIIFSLFVLTHALTENGVMHWLGKKLAMIGAGSEPRLIFLFTITSFLFSLLMNNIAVGALLLPSALSVSKKTEIRPSKLLIPIAFGTAFGGMTTYFTTANIVVSNLLTAAHPPQQPLGILSFASTGGLIALAGIAYLILVGRHLLPTREPGPEQSVFRRASSDIEKYYDLRGGIWEARVHPSSNLVGKTLEQSHIGAFFGLAVIAILRGRQSIFSPSSNQVINPEDILLVVGHEERVSRLRDQNVEIGIEKKSISSFNVTLIELILAPHSSIVGKTIKALNFRRRYGFTTIALLRRGKSFLTDLGDTPLEQGDSLLMIGPPDRLEDLRLNPNVIILETDPASRPIHSGKAAMSILLFVFAIVASLIGVPVFLSVLAAALATLLLRLLSIQDVYRTVQWQVIFFIAGMYAASIAMINTGLAALVSRAALTYLEGYGALGLAAAVFLFSAVLAQFMGSQATAFVVGPIAISAAIHMGASPQAIAVASAIGCSASFITPASHPVNIIMMSPGNYRFGDYSRVGFGLLVVTFISLLAGLYLFWGLR